MVPPDRSRSAAINLTFLCTVFLKPGFICLPPGLTAFALLSISVRTFGQALVKLPASDSSNLSEKVTQGYILKRTYPDRTGTLTFSLDPFLALSVGAGMLSVGFQSRSSKLWGLSGSRGNDPSSVCPPDGRRWGAAMDLGIPNPASVYLRNCRGCQDPGVSSPALPGEGCTQLRSACPLPCCGTCWNTAPAYNSQHHYRMSAPSGLDTRQVQLLLIGQRQLQSREVGPA